jgi:small subunit ribosomal protein S21
MVEYVKDNDLEHALRRLKKRLDKDGVLKAYRSRAEYQPPSVKRRSKARRAKTRALKDAKNAKYSPSQRSAR